MRLIIDCMGGDNAPAEMLKGVAQAKAQLGGDYLLVGHEEQIKTCAAELGISLDAYEILHAPDVVTMEDDAMAPMREKKNSSMSFALKALSPLSPTPPFPHHLKPETKVILMSMR